MIYTEINSVDVSGKIKRDSIRVPDELNERNQVSFILRGSSSGRPAIGQEVIMYEDNTKAAKKFAGLIDDKLETELGDFLKWDILCVGYESILDRFRAPESYTNKTAGYILKDLVSQFIPAVEGITTGNVEDGPKIEKAVFGYDWTIAKCLDKLSDITGYFWYIDYDKDLHFEDRTKNAAPFNIDDDSDIYDFSVRNTREEYRNQEYIRAGNGVSIEISDSFVGNGEQRTWHVRKSFAEEPVITINPGEAGEVVLTGSDIGILDIETGKKYYWNKGETHIVQDDSETLLTISDTLKITYKYLFPIRAFAQDGAEIEARKAIEGNSGIYTHVEDRKSINNSDAAQQEATGLLAKYGEIPEKINYMTFVNGLQAGQLQTITRSNHDIDGKYLISSVSFQPIGWNNGAIQYAYNVTALSGDYVGGWIKFFRKMADAGKEFVIRENEVLIKIKIFSEDLNITDNLTIDTDAYETRVDNAISDYSQVSNLTNIIGITETYPGKTAIVNGEGVTDNIDYALSFDGDNDYVGVADSPDFAGSIAELECEFKTSNTSSQQSLLWKEATGSGGSFWARIEPSSNRIRVLFRDSSDNALIAFTSQHYADGVRHKFKAVYDGSTLKIFIDGVERGTNSGSIGSWDSSKSLYIGKSESSSNYMNGIIYYAKVTIDNMLIMDLKFNEGAGTTLTDYAGSNDGTINGASWIDIYHTKNIGGVTDTTDGTLDDINIIGVTNPDDAISGGQWVYVEGWSNDRY